MCKLMHLSAFNSKLRLCSLSFINSLLMQNALKNRKRKLSHMELFIPSGVVYKDVNAPCITVLNLAFEVS